MYNTDNPGGQEITLHRTNISKKNTACSHQAAKPNYLNMNPVSTTGEETVLSYFL